MVDSHSKWILLFRIQLLKIRLLVFLHFLSKIAIPERKFQILKFTSENFKTFSRNHGVKQLSGAPYYLVTNDQARRCVKNFKYGLNVLTSESAKQEGLFYKKY